MTAPPDSERSIRRRRWPWLAAVAIAAVVVTLVLGAGFGRDPSVVPSTLIGQPAPRLAGATLDGGHVDLRDYRGKVVLVNVWASWCAACREEHPALNAAQRKHGPRGLQIIGINMNDTRADASRFLEEMGGAAYPSVFDPHARAAIEWGTFAVPETYVVNRDGIVVDKAVGAVNEAWIDTAMNRMLEP
ncbi:MAG: TlpA family protein disulfide reductase [Micromonosporaceae bacterium]